MNLPNLITLGRIFSVPVLVWLIIAGAYQWAFAVFVIAGLSDAADGYLAKRFGMRTELGAYLDPIADKALLVSIYVILGYLLYLPVWLVIAVVSRDILIVGAMMLSWIMGKPMAIHPLFISKANTTAQILLAGVVLAELAFSLGLQPTAQALVWIVACLTGLSASAYLLGWIRHMATEEPVTRNTPTSVQASALRRRSPAP